MKLYDHQQSLVDLNPKKHLLAWETGTGKTLAAIELAKKNMKIIPVNNKPGYGITIKLLKKLHEYPLIICPKSLKEQWWEQISLHIGRGMGRVLTKEEFRRDWKELRRYNCLIIDEAHYFSGIKSQMHKSLIKYVKKHKPEYIYLLTATPYLSTPWNIYCLAKILGINWGYASFKNKFFTDVRMGSRIIPIIRKNIEPKIAKLVNTIGNTVKLQSCVDVPEQIYQSEFFGLTTDQRRAIKVIEESETNHIVKWTKTHQICGGTLKGDGYTETKTFNSQKLLRLKDICKEHKKVVVVCRYNAEVEMIASAICDVRDPDETIWFFTGANSETRTQTTKVINGLRRAVVVINAACCEGYELPTFDLMVFYSYDFSLKNAIQMRGRISRINHLKKNVYLSLVVKDTIDEDVYKCIIKKEDFQVAIYAKENNKKIC